MKALFAGARRLVARPFFAAGILLALLLPFSGAFFFQPVSVETPRTFAEEKSDLQDALAAATAEHDAFRGSDREAELRRKVLFFESALRFEVPVWSDGKGAEIVSDYAGVLAEWEILLDHPSPQSAPRAAKMEAEESRLAAVLRSRDFNGYLALLRERLEEDPSLSDGEVTRAWEDATLRLRALSYPNKSAAANLLLSEISVLRESLQTKRDLYHFFAQDAAWNERTETSLSHTLALRVYALENGTFSAVFANTDTLFFLERLSLFLFTCGLFCSLPRAFLLCSPKERSVFPRMLAVLFLLFAVLLSLLLYGAVRLFSPDTILPHLFFCGRVRFISFFGAVLLRILLRMLRPFLFLFLCLCLCGKTKKKGLSALLSFGLYAVFMIASPLTRLFSASSPCLSYLPFAYLDLAEAFFPETPRYLPTPSPLVSTLFFLVLVILLSFWHHRISGREAQGSIPPK